MPKKYLYDGYVRTLSDRFATLLSEIQVEHGFEYGDEFEIAICHVLRAALPQKYGVCRGYVVDSQGNKAGDDIIIYAQDRFPTLRLKAPADYSLKEKVPIEAVYAYIEAKHSLVLSGNGNSSLDKACRQVAAVKELVSTRKPRPLTSPDAYLNYEVAVIPDSSRPLHSIRNPVYGVVLSRYVKHTESGPHLQGNAIAALLRERNSDGDLIFPNIPICLFPDLIIAGEGVVTLPCAVIDGATQPTFFNQQDTRAVAVQCIEDIAFGAAFSCLFFALDWIRLGTMPFPEIIADAFDLKVLR